MQKKLLCCLMSLLLSGAYAETCPTIQAIKNNSFRQQGWQVYDLENGEPLESEDFNMFKKHLISFASAIWLPGAPEGNSQCHYYNDSDIEAYFAKNMQLPDKTKGNWRLIGDMLECNISLQDCQFLPA